MRPLTLRLIGFRSYADETIDFRHHGLVVISGDTGAGKTSILDGISFALFGRTSEVAGSRELLTLGATHGETVLTFSAGQATWRVTRRFGRDAPEPAHLLEQLEDDDVVDRVIGATTVNTAVAALIGMTFQSFTSAVMLAQGRFAQFLQAAPKDRDGILRELFGITSLDAVRATAVATRDAHLAAADALDDERGRLGQITQTERAARARAARTAASTLATLQSLQPLVAHLDAASTEIARATHRGEQIRLALDEVGTSESHQNVIDEHAALLRTLTEARLRRDDAQRSLDEAMAGREQLRLRHGGTATELGSLRAHAERAALAKRALPAERDDHERRRADLHARQRELNSSRSRLGVLTTARETREAIANALTRVISTRSVVTQSTHALAAARTVREEARRSAQQAAEDAAVADSAMGELRHAHVTEQLRGELVPGKPCPVCRQTVYSTPSPPVEDLAQVEAGVATLHARSQTFAAAAMKADANLRSAELHDATARTAAADAVAMLRAVGGSVDDDEVVLSALRHELADLEREHALLGPQVEALSAQVEHDSGSLLEAERRLQRDQAEIDELATRLGEWAAVDDPVTALSSAVKQLELLEQSVLQSTRYVGQATTHVEAAEDVVRTFEVERMGALRQALAVLATRLDTPPPAPELAPAALVTAAAGLVEFGQTQADQAAQTVAAANATVAELSSEIAAHGADVGVQSARDLAPRLRSAATARRSTREALAAIETAAAEARRLDARARDERRRADLYGQVAIDLQANRFPRFLLSRFHERLALGATSRLLALSHGAFSFTGSEPDHLAVVDHRRDHRVRSAATLSGGERFLASLSLALALADIASGAEGRLECLFLDEGFSSLDADSLELAISGVEQMAHDGRLVVIITHLPGVAERLGAAIHVRKDPGGTSHVIDIGERRRAESGRTTPSV
jgi:exonuclease SbcC